MPEWSPYTHGCSGRLFRILAVAWLGVLISTAIGAAETLHVQVPPECAPQNGNVVASAYPFIDRLGDMRFSPRGLARPPDARTIVQPDLKGLLVSAASMTDRETLLITTYQSIFSLNVKTGRVATLKPDLSKITNKKYVPTGIAIGPRTGKIFVANYLANNILVGHLFEDNVIFDQELGGEGVVSPENVTTTADESWVVSANFDGSSATAFFRDSDRYVHRWNTKIPQAHGVAIIGNMVFVSSLTLRKIVVLNLTDGKEIGSFGQPGWNTACLDFLWPTGLHVFDDNLLVVTDAHTGGIYRIAFEGEAGKLIGVIGGTAPGALGLQMPYAVASIGDELAILSTFSPKVLIAGPVRASEPPLVKTLIVQQSNQGQDSADQYRPPLGVGWNGYVQMAAGPATISGFSMVPSYGALMQVTQERPMKVRTAFWMVPDTLALFGSLMYFIEERVMERGVVLSSPSSPFALYVTLGKTSCFSKIDLPGPALAAAEGLQHRLGITRYSEIESQALAHIRELDGQRTALGILGLAEIAKLSGIPADKVKETIKTPEGNAALDKIVQCIDKKNCSGGQAESALYAYKSQVMSSSQEGHLFELLYLDMSVHRCVP
jgi:DNA-binding beta-propeller fold protein YncE